MFGAEQENFGHLETLDRRKDLRPCRYVSIPLGRFPLHSLCPCGLSEHVLTFVEYERSQFTLFNFLGVPARLIFHKIKIDLSARAGKVTVIEKHLYAEK
jgi:hypothetical protein